MEEIWKPVKGFTKYFVSNLGRVKNSHSNLIVKQYETHGRRSGDVKPSYLACWLTNGVDSKQKRVHRLIAQAFIGDVEGRVVDHIDRDTLNNNLSNLRIVTAGENSLNCKVRRNKKIKYKGVTVRGEKFFAFVTKDKKQTYSMFDTAEEAAEWYDRTAVLIHGPGVTTNKSLGII